jgi:hypothetical protein
MSNLRLKDLSFKVKKAWRGISYSMRISERFPKHIERVTKIIYGAIIGFSVFILAGGIYNLLEKPLALLPQGGGWTFIYRGSVHMQTLNESIVVAIVYVLGLSGLYVIFRSTKYAYRPRQAYILLLIGVIVTLISFLYINFLLQSKIG